MRILAGLGGVIVLVAACSSSGPASGTETITGTVTGAAAVRFLNSSGSTPPSFPSLVLTGPVDTTASGPFGGPATTNTPVFSTRAGKLALRLSAKTSQRPTLTSQSGGICHYTLAGGGSYTVTGSRSTGTFAGAGGHGSYTVTIRAAAKLRPGTTTCDASNVGAVIAKGTSITFRASGPLSTKR